MTTPIYDFLRSYAEKDGIRLHMPGHKGHGPLGIEALDITEIAGADILSEADGIIGESERNATALFGSGRTVYTTGGSTSAIQAMLALAVKRYRSKEAPAILASRNAHRAFLQGVALLDIPVEFMLPGNAETVYSGVMSASEVEDAIMGAQQKPFAVYITSPGYLGDMWDIAAIAAVCKKHGLPLLVDNAHGAYLAFLAPSLHPIRLGAAMCADSAHKTLPVLTGGAYLHIGDAFLSELSDPKEAIALFSRTSPSYLTLASLDLANRALAEEYGEKLMRICERVAEAKARLKERGFTLLSAEPLKISLSDGDARRLAEAVRAHGIEPELVDATHLVFMASAENKVSDIDALEQVLLTYTPIEATKNSAPRPRLGKQVLSIREALFAPHETVDVENAIGRVYAEITASCPPAVPIAVCGEEITEHTVEAFKYYGIHRVRTVK